MKGHLYDNTNISRRLPLAISTSLSKHGQVILMKYKSLTQYHILLTNALVTLPKNRAKPGQWVDNLEKF